MSGAGALAVLGGQAQHEGRLALLDLGTGCVLRESFEGYCATLTRQDVSFSEIAGDWRQGSGTAIVPGVGVMDRGTTSLLLDLLRAGWKVVFESGAGFLSREDFALHQNMLFDNFGLIVDSPIDLWSEAASLPYVSYNWPRNAMVRDFSRVVPVLAPEGEIIGRAGCLPVASRRLVGRGVLVFVGSPMGPAMLAGDPQGREWLRLVRSA